MVKCSWVSADHHQYIFLGFSHILHLLVKYPCEQFTHSAKHIKSPVRATPGSEKHRHENTPSWWSGSSLHRTEGRRERETSHAFRFFPSFKYAGGGGSLGPYLTRNLWLTARPHNTLTLRVQTEGGGRRWAGERGKRGKHRWMKDGGKTKIETTCIHVR